MDDIYENELIEQLITAAYKLDGYRNGKKKAYKNEIGFRFEIQDDSLLNALSQQNKKSKNADFKAVKENEMPPKYSDGSFRQRGNVLEYRFMYNGKQVPVYGRSKNECWDERTKILSGKTKTKSINLYTFGEWNIKFYNTYKVRKDGTKINPKNEEYILNYINPALGKVPLKSLTGLHIQEYLKNYDDKTNTREKLYDLINSSLKMAAANQLIKFNPCAAVKIEQHIPESYNTIHPREQNFILSKINIPKYLDFFKFCCVSGLRIGEAIASIPHIDYVKNIITVVNEDKSTKKHKRQIPFLPGFWDKELLEQITYEGVQLYFTDFFKKYNLDFVVHSFRHAFASCCYHIGFRDKQIQEWLGHSSIKMTMDVYTHIIDNEDSPILAYLRRLKEHLGL